MIFLLLTVMGKPEICEKASEAAAVRSVESFQQLEDALWETGELKINLKSDITVSKCLRIRGKKILSGAGKYQIRRKAASGSTYKGTLFDMQGHSLTLQGITIYGSGKNNIASSDIHGRLIEVSSGSVILEKGTSLTGNYNTSSYTDGGGGITIHRGGNVCMKEGSVIRDHMTITGGSAVRVEEGGTFVMEGGTIADNAVLGQKKDSDFDGRGGAIHNRGIVLIQGGVIKDNVAAAYRGKGSPEGGFGGAIYNQNIVKITGGILCGNKGEFAGGAIYANKNSVTHITGGEIRGNQSPGHRGGGLYLSAQAVINIDGGSVYDNVAEDGTQIFMGSNSQAKLKLRGGRICGKRTAIYNNGGFVDIRSGVIEGGQCGIRVMGQCEIRGGQVRGQHFGVFYGAGTLSVSGSPVVDSVYLKENRRVRVDQKISMTDSCELCPEYYREGDKVVEISSGETEDSVRKSFTLRKKKNYLLEPGTGCLYIDRAHYVVKFVANGGKGIMGEQKIYVDESVQLDFCSFWREGYGFAGWGKQPGVLASKESVSFRQQEQVKNLAGHGAVITLYAMWAKKPVLSCVYENLHFYEGEYVDKNILLGGMKAEDEQDGDLSEKIRIARIVLPDSTESDRREVLPTESSRLGKGEIYYQVENSYGVKSEYCQTYEVLPNQMPEVTVSDRYFFIGEYDLDTTEQGKADILGGVAMSDDVESAVQLQRNTTILWNNLNFEKEGNYRITVRTKDQFGNRFYMEPGEERQYGTGKIQEICFEVHIVMGANYDRHNAEEGFVRFISQEHMESLADGSQWRKAPLSDMLSSTFQKTAENGEEVWTVSGEDKKKIKAFMKARDDPFSKETNDLFLKEFSYLRAERKGD